jgi:hypothetical protein
MTDQSTDDFEVNGHTFETDTEFDGDRVVECSECLVRELVHEGDDPEDRLELLTPECRIEWLREPDGGFRGVALRNASGFSGRQLIAVDSDGEVTDTVRVYDEDARRLASLIDPENWEDIQPRAAGHPGGDRR